MTRFLSYDMVLFFTSRISGTNTLRILTSLFEKGIRNDTKHDSLAYVSLF